MHMAVSNLAEREKVYELPSKPVIFDEFGNEITGVVGPYNEGDDFKLICTVTGDDSFMRKTDDLINKETHKNEFRKRADIKY
ncbi:unnamed protein product [Leptidea sinapis]|uniref:Uncharacterized protein n=1 Tax=Leptidea sinapis TaxID=189913 RepID=A0A5E4QLB4_9NEOP|nr:unnamed protein product [Leptidea sinapis]